MYESEEVAFLLDHEDPVHLYEEKSKAKAQAVVDDQNKQLMNSMDRVQMMEVILGYNELKEHLGEYLKKFVENKKVVRVEDIQEFFEGMKARKKSKVEIPFNCRWGCFMDLKLLLFFSELVVVVSMVSARIAHFFSSPILWVILQQQKIFILFETSIMYFCLFAPLYVLIYNTWKQNNTIKFHKVLHDLLVQYMWLPFFAATGSFSPVRNGFFFTF